MFVLVDWRTSVHRLSSKEELLLDEVHYFDYLKKNSSDNETVHSYDLKFFKGIKDRIPEEELEKSQMVPTGCIKDMFYSV
jgi:hypothetical protein